MAGYLLNVDVEGNDFELIYSRRASVSLKADHWYILRDTKVVIEVPSLQNLSLFSVKNNSFKETFTIPKGFLTDGSSVPRFLWSIFPKWDITRRAVIIHDYLLENPYSYHDNGGSLMFRKLSREYIDEIFYQILLFDGVSKTRARAIYYAVKLYSTFIAMGQTERASEEKKKIEESYRQS